MKYAVDKVWFDMKNKIYQVAKEFFWILDRYQTWNPNNAIRFMIEKVSIDVIVAISDPLNPDILLIEEIQLKGYK